MLENFSFWQWLFSALISGPFGAFIGARYTQKNQMITKSGVPKYPVGQIIFDVNGEYANQNLQDISLDRSKISSEFTFSCSECNGVLYLIDVLRLHEAIDDELGAGGILGYLSSALEQLLIVFIITAALFVLAL